MKGEDFNPEFAVAIYCGLKILSATLVYCFETPVLLTGSQRELSALSCLSYFILWMKQNYTLHV